MLSESCKDTWAYLNTQDNNAYIILTDAVSNTKLYYTCFSYFNNKSVNYFNDIKQNRNLVEIKLPKELLKFECQKHILAFSDKNKKSVLLYRYGLEFTWSNKKLHYRDQKLNNRLKLNTSIQHNTPLPFSKGLIWELCNSNNKAFEYWVPLKSFKYEEGTVLKEVSNNNKDYTNQESFLRFRAVVEKITGAFMQIPWRMRSIYLTYTWCIKNHRKP